MRKVFSVLAGILTALSCGALEWNLPSAIWCEYRFVPGDWDFYSFPRNSVEGKKIDQVNINHRDNRIIYHSRKGDVWSRPAVHRNNFAVPAEQTLTFYTSKDQDPAAVFTVTIPGSYAFEAVVSDVAKPGSPGQAVNAQFRVELHRGKQLIKLKRDTFLNRKDVKIAGTVQARKGDKLVFRKTVLAADDYGRNSCIAKLKVRLDNAPEQLAFVMSDSSISLEDARMISGSRQKDGSVCFGDHPYVAIQEKSAEEFIITARGEKDSKVKNAGNVLLMKKVKNSGTYLVSWEISNPGLNVKGGDGGFVELLFMGKSSPWITGQLKKQLIPPSNVSKVITGSVTLSLEGGEYLGWRFRPLIDGYGDKFQVRMNFKAVDAKGVRPQEPAADSILVPKDVPLAGKGAPFRKEMFFLGCNGLQMTSPLGREIVTHFSRYQQNFALMMVGSRPDQYPDVSYFSKKNIPVLVQSFGSSYEPYWRTQGAFEWDSRGLCHAVKNSCYLSGGAHAVSMPHPAVKEAFERLAKGSIRKGFSGYGFIDLVWFWGAGPGEAGFSPATVAAFRESLSGRDKGIEIADKNGSKRIYFADYAASYLGSAPKAEWFGLKDFSSYSPLTSEFRKKNQDRDFSRELLLFDLLVHYEWLKAADRIGGFVKAENGVFQVIPNCEDLSNGVDWLYLARLKNVTFKTEEFFQSPSFLTAAYSRFNYYRQNTAPGTEAGVVIEVGHGGNGVPYYTSDAALRIAYELPLATGAAHLEGDFWHNTQLMMKEALQYPRPRLRYQGILAYALGWRFSQVDKHKMQKLPADYVALTSRGIFRPWYKKWQPWSCHLDNEGSADSILFRSGFIPDSRGEETVMDKDFSADIVLYTPSYATECFYDRFIGLIKEGRIKRGVIALDAFKEMVGRDWQRKKFTSAFAPGCHKLGKGTLHVVKSRQELPVLFDKLGRKAHWKSDKPLEVRLYQGKDRMLISAQRYDALKKAQNGVYAEKADGNAVLTLPLNGRKYTRAMLFPEGEFLPVTMKADGLAEIALGNRAYVLLLLSNDETVFKAAHDRIELYRDAMKLKK